MAEGIRSGTCPFLMALLACGKGTVDLFVVDASGATPMDSSVSAEVAPEATPVRQGLDADSDAVDSIVESSDVALADATSAPRDAAAELGEGEAGAGGCLLDSDCPSSFAPRCEPSLHRCVQCIGASDCANQRESACNPSTYQCALPCTTTRDCASPDICDVAHGVCVDCLSDSQCESSRPFCVQEECVECRMNSDCPGGELCWQQRCVACVTNADCRDGGRCSTSHVCI